MSFALSASLMPDRPAAPPADEGEAAAAGVGAGAGVAAAALISFFTAGVCGVSGAPNTPPAGKVNAAPLCPAEEGEAAGGIPMGVRGASTDRAGVEPTSERDIDDEALHYTMRFEVESEEVGGLCTALLWSSRVPRSLRCATGRLSTCHLR